MNQPKNQVCVFLRSEFKTSSFRGLEMFIGNHYINLYSKPLKSQKTIFSPREVEVIQITYVIILMNNSHARNILYSFNVHNYIIAILIFFVDIFLFIKLTSNKDVLQITDFIICCTQYMFSDWSRACK
jgi:hypothetical protein